MEKGNNKAHPDIDTLVFATNNAHKLEEVQAIVGSRFRIIGLQDAGCREELPETADTLTGNALQKARYVYTRLGRNCFADDTGLEVEALQGAPGVYSARYAGPGCSAADNMDKLLCRMQGKENRKASFRTVIALILDGQEHLFEGTVGGNIIRDRRGTEGFGYDPLFIPQGYTETFAQLGAEIKNEISHRAQAVKQLAAFLAERQ